MSSRVVFADTGLPARRQSRTLLKRIRIIITKKHRTTQKYISSPWLPVLPFSRHFSLHQDTTAAAFTSAVASPSEAVSTPRMTHHLLPSGVVLRGAMTRRLQLARGGVLISPFLGDETSPNSLRRQENYLRLGCGGGEG